MRYPTEIRLAGPARHPAQMLASRENDGHLTIHDGVTAETLGLAGAPIEAPTHFSQFDPLAQFAFGDKWFQQGCISAHFRNMVLEGDEVRANLTVHGNDPVARISAEKGDGTEVLTGTASVGPDYGETELSSRLRNPSDPGDLRILDLLDVGMREDGLTVSISFREPNGAGYPFSLAEKLALITEPHPWYTAEGAEESPWGRPILPFEMISVLAHREEAHWPIRTPSLSVFLDLEVRLVRGPLFAEEPYLLDREIVGLSQSRRTESYWTRTTVRDMSSRDVLAQVLLHTGVFKESYADYPAPS
jgi:hypothetical protein